jgi:hypothetical protein
LDDGSSNIREQPTAAVGEAKKVPPGLATSFTHNHLQGLDGQHINLAANMAPNLAKPQRKMIRHMIVTGSLTNDQIRSCWLQQSQHLGHAQKPTLLRQHSCTPQWWRTATIH